MNIIRNRNYYRLKNRLFNIGKQSLFTLRVNEEYVNMHFEGVQHVTRYTRDDELVFSYSNTPDTRISIPVNDFKSGKFVVSNANDRDTWLNPEGAVNMFMFNGSLDIDIIHTTCLIDSNNFNGGKRFTIGVIKTNKIENYIRYFYTDFKPGGLPSIVLKEEDLDDFLERNTILQKIGTLNMTMIQNAS